MKALIKNAPFITLMLVIFLIGGCNKKQNTEPSDDGLSTVSFERSSQSFPNYETHQIGLGDFDGDGDLDVFVAYYGDGSNSVWFNR